MSPTKGCLIHTLGKRSSMVQLYRDTIFVDHATNYIFNDYLVNHTAATTVESKHKCESRFDKFGAQIKQYAPNNHPYRSKIWADDYAVQLQLPISHSGVEAYHQVLAERYIQPMFNLS